MKLQLSLLAAVALLAGCSKQAPPPQPSPEDFKKVYDQITADAFEAGYYIGILDGIIDDEWLSRAKDHLSKGEYTAYLQMIVERTQKEKDKREDAGIKL